MTKAFIFLYNYFKAHKAVFYSILISTTIVFGYFSTKIHFEENILALLPQTDQSEECAVAFGSIKEKDKLFVEVAARNNGKSTYELAQAMDNFVAILKENDSEGYLEDVFTGLDQDDLMNIVYYLMGALPCHLPQDIYPMLDSLMTGERIDALIEGEGNSILARTGSFTIADGHLFPSDKAFALAIITPSFDAMDTGTGNRCDNMISSCIRTFEKANPEYEVLYHGACAESNYNAKQIKKDLCWTVGISLLLICLVICLCFRSRRTLLHLIAPVAYGTIFSLACIYWIKGSMSFIAMGIAAIVLGVALSYCLHVITHHKFVSDVETVIREQARPVCLGCLTTIGAFIGLLFTSSELLRDFGMFASLALIGTTFFALAFLPQFFTGDDIRKNDKAFDLVNRINSYSLDRNKAVVVTLCAICIICIIKAGDVQFDCDLANIGYREPKVIKSETLYNSSINQSHFCQYIAVTSSDIDSAIVMSEMMDSKLDSLKREGIIYNYSGTESILVPEAKQRENIDRWKEYWTPEKEACCYALLRKYDDEYHLSEAAGMDVPETFRLLAESDYEPQSLYDAGVVPEGLLSNFVENNECGWLVFANALMDRDRRWEVCDHVAECGELVVLDPFYYAGDMVRTIHDDFHFVLLFSSIFVFIVLLLSFKSIILSLIGFLPMFLSWYIVQGAMAIFDIQFNLINIMISTFIFGIGVDYSIFVMEGLISKATNSSYRLLLCHKSAIFFSAFTLIVVTASLLFAKHPAIHSIGISTIIGMVSTILITYALQPLLFRLVMKNGRLRKLTLHEK